MINVQVWTCNFVYLRHVSVWCPRELSDYRDVNNDVIEMLIMAYACKTSSSHKVVGVLPYLPYSKQSKMRKRGSIVSHLVASMICKAGMSTSQELFSCPNDKNNTITK